MSENHFTNNAPVGRTLPHSLEAEEYLLSCCLLDGRDVVARCKEARIIPGVGGSMYVPKHGIVLAVIYAIDDSGRAPDINVVAEELKTRGELDQIGGYAFLTQISSRIPTTAQASYFIEKVREQALLRGIIRSCTGAVEDCYGFSGGIEEFVDQIESKIFSVTQERVDDRLEGADSLVKRSIATMTGMIQRKGEKTGLCSGFTDLDNYTWGFQPADLIVLAARPSIGKTALALNISERAVLDGRPVLFFSLEMTGHQLMQRMISSNARVNMRLLRDGLLARCGDELSRMVATADRLGRSPLFVDDSSAVSVSHIRARARRLHARKALGLIVVDYLQLMTPASSKVSREQQVAESSRGLKMLAKELNVPVLVLSQLNRAADKEDRPPRLSDLRESGSVEQDADVVLLLARPKGTDDRFQVAGDSADLYVAKQRNGPVGLVKLTFLRDITRFENHHQ